MAYHFDFSSLIDRSGKDALAVDAVTSEGGWGFEPDAPKEGFDLIPMWVADMNFATCPSITRAIHERVDHPLFGYFSTRPEYAERIVAWQQTRHGHRGLLPEHIGYENGVHGFVTSAVNVLSQPGDKVFLHRPTYIGFAEDVDHQGRTPVYSDLVKDDAGVYRMDFDDMDRKLRENNIHLAIFCSPHNPAGRVWERWELERAMEVFERNDCYVISDEIWSDITYAGHEHIPTQMTNDWAREHVVAAYSLSKTFNLAGLVGSHHIIYNKYLRDRVSSFGSRTNYNNQNVLSMHALLGAYTDEGHAWVDELNRVLEGNCRFMTELINRIDGVEVTMPEGTYMLFADLSGYCARSGRTQREVLKAGWDVGVAWQDGAAFGGPRHLRINVASPLPRLEEAGKRMLEYVFVD